MRYLRYIREKKGLTQQELAKRAGVTQDSVSRIETGERDPRRSTLEKLALALEVEDPSMLALPMAPYSTFEELIEGTPGRRRTYFKVMREEGILDDFAKRLERLFREGMEDYRDDSLTLARIQAAFMLGYAKALRE